VIRVPSDHTVCPCCAAEGAPNGADIAVNYDGGARAIRVVYGARWYVTRAMGGLPDGDDALMCRLAEVEPLDDRAAA